MRIENLLSISVFISIVHGAISLPNWSERRDVPFFLLFHLYTSNVANNAIHQFANEFVQVSNEYASKMRAALEHSSTNVDSICDGYKERLCECLKRIPVCIDQRMNELIEMESYLLIATERQKHLQVSEGITVPMSLMADYSNEPKMIQSIMLAVESQVRRASSVLLGSDIQKLDKFESIHSTIASAFSDALSFINRTECSFGELENAIKFKLCHFRISSLLYVCRMIPKENGSKRKETIIPASVLPATPMALTTEPKSLSLMILAVLSAAQLLLSEPIYLEFKDSILGITPNPPSVSNMPELSQSDIIVMAHCLSFVGAHRSLQAIGSTFGFLDYFHAYTVCVPVIEQLRAQGRSDRLEMMVNWATDYESHLELAGLVFRSLGVEQLIEGQLRAFRSLQCPLSELLSTIIDDKSVLNAPHKVSVLSSGNTAPSVSILELNNHVYGFTTATSNIISNALHQRTITPHEKAQLKLRLGSLEGAVMCLQAKVMLSQYTKVPVKNITDTKESIQREIMALYGSLPQIPIKVLKLIEYQVEYIIQLYKCNQFAILPNFDVVRFPTLLSYFERQLVNARHLPDQPKESLKCFLHAEMTDLCRYVQLEKATFSRIFNGTPSFSLILCFVVLMLMNKLQV